MLKLSVINEACEGATPGPWEEGEVSVVVAHVAGERQMLGQFYSSPSRQLCDHGHDGKNADKSLITYKTAQANRDFAVMARTALPAFLLARKALSAYCAGSGDDTPLQVFDKALLDLAEIEAKQ